MIGDPLNPATYTPTAQLALRIDAEQREKIAERWHDEASEAALAGNPKRAWWCEMWARRIA